mmetsp:Transcript_15417/g.13149  ORF Transcript_15417/g.13149 Transcript_15417/m.13149 type:complete len:161 (-) Transcript_15417:1303-1785(-)
MNPQSSRSHAIFQITVEASTPGSDGKNAVRVGKLNLVDLAGSERIEKTKVTGIQETEAKNILKSLFALMQVISALANPKSQHIPFRDSKLTMMLRNSLEGNSKTVMIATMGPADMNYEETINTLVYANKAKNIKTKPKINTDPKDAMILNYQSEIANLRA